MKRAHRKTHILLWLIIAAVMVATLFFAVQHRPDAPVNDALPDILIEEAS